MTGMSTKLSRICDGIMEATWLAAIIVVPIFFNIYSSRIFEPDKITLLRTLALLMLGAWIVKLIGQGGVRWDKLEWKGSFVKSVVQIPMVLPALALATIYIVSTIFSVTPRVSFWGSYQRLQGTYTTLSYLIVFFVLIANLRRREQVERLVTTIILASLPVSIYGILQKNLIDPVPWGGNVSNRIASNMGNSIFVAAYLIMTIPLAAGRVVQSLTAILKDEDRLWAQIIRSTLYIFILAVNIIAVVLSGSRGPFLGLLVGLVLLVLLLTIYWRVRWATWLLVIVALIAGIFLVMLNVPNGPLENLRSAPWVGRFGHIFDTEQRTSQVRIYIWKGAAELVGLHDPLVKPDGSHDSFNFIRPLIGYGPEGMYVAYNQFYPPELGSVEKRNASPDRSHNETWDSLVTTGIIGLTVYLWIFGSVFYFGLKWLTLIDTQRQRILFWILIIFGGVGGVIAMGIWQGWEFFGVGLPFGSIAGLMLYVGYHSLFVRYSTDEKRLKGPGTILIMTLLAAIVGHFAEINFGIAIAVTRTYFWVYTAMIVLLGFILPRCESALVTAPAEQAPVKKQKARAEQSGIRRQRGWLPPAIIGGYIVGLILATLGYDFITNSARTTSIGKIIWTSFTRLPNRDNALSYGVLALILATWLVGTLIVSAENSGVNNGQNWLRAFGATVGISGGIAFLFYVVHAVNLVGLSQVSIATQEDYINQANAVGGMLTAFYIFLFLLIIAVAAFFIVEWPTRSKSKTAGWVAAIAAIILFWSFAYFLNLRVVHADMTFKMADPFTKNDQWPVATLFYQRALELVPNEDHYYLFMGRSYLEQAKDLQGPEEQANFVEKAAQDLKKAQRINPLNTDHTANLGRLYSWWAGRAASADERSSRGEVASGFYETATKLSPNNPTLWGEWAILHLDILGDRQGAQDLLNHAISLDERYNFTQGLMGDYYLRLARSEEDVTAKKAYFEQALGYYQNAVDISVGRDASTKSNYLISLGNTYIELANLDSTKIDQAAVQKAINTFLSALDTGVSAANRWKVEETIAKLYAQLGDFANALIHAQIALEAAPEASKERVQTFIDQITIVP
jgi:tetratricopeptide (TPR) repeat protein